MRIGRRHSTRAARGRVRNGSYSVPLTMSAATPRFRLSSVDCAIPSFAAWGMPSSPPSYLPQRHHREAHEEGISGMPTIIKVLLVGAALMLLASCGYYQFGTGTSYQTPCLQGNICECVQYTTLNRSWL